MKKYTLPFDIYDADSDNITIDMSMLNFDVPDNKQKKSSFIFIRNSGVKANFDFSNCSYEDKEEYLLLYLTEDIDVDIDILATTWIEILSSRDGAGIVLPSILTVEEIDRFVSNNSEFISEIYQLINSLPIYSLLCSQYNGVKFTTDEFKHTDYDRIKISNFSKLSRFDAFILLIDGSTEPLFYDKLFIKGEYHISDMMSRLPYLNMLSALFVDSDMQDIIIDKINESFTI